MRKRRKRLKVAFVAPVRSVHSHKWINGLAKAGCQIEVIAFRGDEIEGIKKNKNVKIHQIATIKTKVNIWNKFLLGIKAWQTIREIKADVINAHYLSGFGWLAVFFPNAPVVLTVWGGDVFEEPRKFPFNILNPLALRLSSKITVHSEYMKNYLVDKWNIPKSKVWKGGFGIDKNIFNDKESHDYWLRKLDIKKNQQTILHLRFLQPVYNPLTVLNAWFKLNLINKNTVLLLLGYRGDKIIKQKIESLVKKQKLAHKIRFIETLNSTDLASLMKSVNLGVCIPSSDGMPISLWEAMACGCPLVVSDLPQYDKLIQQNKNGLRVRVKSVKETTQAMSKILTDQKLAQNLSEGGIKEAKKIPTVTNEMKRVKRLFEELSA